MVRLRRQAPPKATTLVTALRDTVATVASQAELAATLRAGGIDGPRYLAAVEAEDAEALVYLPVTDRQM